ncbi:MAG: hypothetical protein R3C59_27090, partial [Planctomycetaceae bacterium]
MDNFLTIREACEFTGKSESTIKRLIHSVIKDAKSDERSLISPTVNELKQKQKSGEPYIWKIARSLLEDRYPPQESVSESEAAKDSAAQSGGAAANDRLVTVLEKTIAVLEEELSEKNRQIQAFQERQREQNLLLKNLHDRFAIAGPASTAPTGTVDAEPEQSSAEQGSDLRKHSDDAKQSV